MFLNRKGVTAGCTCFLWQRKQTCRSGDRPFLLFLHRLFCHVLGGQRPRTVSNLQKALPVTRTFTQPLLISFTAIIVVFFFLFLIVIHLFKSYSSTMPISPPPSSSPYHGSGELPVSKLFSYAACLSLLNCLTHSFCFLSIPITSISEFLPFNNYLAYLCPFHLIFPYVKDQFLPSYSSLSLLMSPKLVTAN